MANHGEVVRNEEVGDLQLHLQILEQVDDACLDRHVERGDGLVEKEQLGACGEGARDGDALALAAGELRREAVDVVRVDAHEVHELANALVYLGLVPALGLEGLCQHVVDGHAGVERAHGVLEDDLEVAAQLAAIAGALKLGGLLPQDGDRALLRHHEVHDLHERGGLARAGLADKRQRLALVDGERGVVDRRHGSLVPADEALALDGEGLHQVLNLKHHRSLVARDVGPLGQQRLERRVDVRVGKVLVANLVHVVARDQVTLPRLDGQKLGLGLATLVGCHGAARREGAACGNCRKRGRIALDGNQAMLGRHVGLGHGAEKTHGIGLRRTLEERVDARALNRAASVHDHHVIRRTSNNAQVVGDEHDGGTSLLLRDLKDVQDLCLDGHVEGGGGLVGDDDVGVVRDSDGNHHALAHAARELVGIRVKAVLGVGDANQGEQLDAALANLVLGHVGVVDEQSLGKLVADGEHGSKGRERILEDHGDARAADLGHLLVALADEFLAVELDRARDVRVVIEKPDEREGRDRLSRAGLAYDAQGAATPEVKVHVAHGVDHAGLGIEGDTQVANAHDGVAGRRALGTVALEQLVAERVVHGCGAGGVRHAYVSVYSWCDPAALPAAAAAAFLASSFLDSSSATSPAARE